MARELKLGGDFLSLLYLTRKIVARTTTEAHTIAATTTRPGSATLSCECKPLILCDAMTKFDGTTPDAASFDLFTPVSLVNIPPGAMDAQE